MKVKKEDEEILKVSNTRKVYVPFYCMMIILVGALLYILYEGKEVNTFALKLVLGFCVFVFVATEIHRIYNSYEVNNHSVVHKKGIFSITSKRLEFGAISDSDVRQTLWQRLWGFGDVEIHLFSRENTTAIRDIDKPYNFVAFLQKKMRAFRGGRTR
jgi:uncharacterized membrane protein YdbT with pleckstrin-like domain